MITLLLAGCAWLTEEDLAGIRDGDGDGVPVWEDCADDDGAVGAAGPGFEDADGDGIGGAAVVACPDALVTVEGDCDDADATVGSPAEWFADVDGDGFTGTTGPVVACEAPDATSSEGPGADCDDGAPLVSPDAVEDCNNGIDDDCDAATDECNLRDAGLVLHYGREAGGLGGFPSLYVPTSKGYSDLVIARPWEHSVESYPGIELPRSGEFLLGEPDWVVQDGPISLGSALAGGELDGDGIPDLVVGAASSSQDVPPYDVEPKIAFLRGPVYDGDSSVDQTIVAETSTSEFGQSLTIGDFDDDGVNDLAVGAPGSESGCGGVFVALGGPTFPEWAQINAFYNDPDSDGLKLDGSCGGNDASAQGGFGGATVAVPAGVSEVRPALLAIGDPNADDGTGKLYVWRYGTVPTEDPRTLDLSTSDDVEVWTGEERGDLAGISIATGDLDGDGHADLVTGAMYADENVGRAYVVHDIANQTGGSLAGADVEVRGEPSEDGATPTNFGYAVAVVPDVDGDGYDELAIGAPGWTGGTRGYRAGAVYLFHGPVEGVIDAAEADSRLYGAYEEEFAGWTLDAGGDLDGDGRGELLVGVPKWSPAGTKPWYGAIVVLWGGDW